MKEMSTTILKIFGIWYFLYAIRTAGNIPMRVIFDEQWTVDTVYWILQDFIFPLTIAILVFSFAGKLASKISSGSVEIDASNSDTLLPVAVFILGIYLLITSLPSLIMLTLNMLLGNAPGFQNLWLNGYIYNGVALAASILFIIKPNMFNRHFSNVSK